MGNLLKWKNMKIFQEESYCNEWATQGGKYIDFLEKGLIVMGDLPSGENTEIFQKGSH
jgi:hypothetical protein